MLRIPSVNGASLELEDALVTLQSWANREMGGVGWVSLSRADLIVTGDSGITFTVNDNLTISSTPGFFKYIRIGPTVTVSLNLGLTPSAVTGQVNVLLRYFGVVGRVHAVGYDSSGNALSLTLGTPLETIGNTTLDPFQVSILHVEKLSGADFPASAFALQGQVTAELAGLHVTGLQ
jgi:hypothetical protein